MEGYSKYVGARYMPKFLTGVHDPTQEYEALSVVNNGMGTSYVAIQPVPAGIPLTNTNYWAVYGSTSGAILNLQNQIDAIKKGLGTPEMFGANGDGITDDSIAFQTCVNSSGVVILKNEYLLNSSINIPDGVIIIGLNAVIKTDTRDNILNFKGNNTISGVTFSDSLNYDASSGSYIYAENTNNICVINCSFDTIGNGHCILMEHCNHMTINHNNFKNYGFSGIMLQSSCAFAEIAYNNLYNARYRGGEHNYPICISGYQDYDYGVAHHICVKYNHIEEVTPFWEGIDSHGARDYEIIGNTIKNCRYGIALGATRTSSQSYFTDANRNIIVSNNNIDVNTSGTDLSYGITIENDSNGTASNIEVNNNIVKVSNSNSATTAIVSGINLRFDGVIHNVNISNNRIYAIHCHGIALDGSFENVTIDNNYCEYLDTTEDYSVISLRYVDNYSNITISNNSIDETLVTGRFIYGPSNAPQDNKLIEFKNNYFGSFSLREVEYITSPKAALPTETKLSGVCGQFIPATGSDTVAGWFCKAAGSWVAVSGTSV